MTQTMQRFDTFLVASDFYAAVPGPDRKRTIRPYRYRVTFCNEQPEESGCIFTCEVVGGRNEYQVALERDEDGELRWHCTCADAVYRERCCKHIRGLQNLGRPSEN
jgi:hypothetical protein